jgi:hypothetical protein
VDAPQHRNPRRDHLDDSQATPARITAIRDVMFIAFDAGVSLSATSVPFIAPRRLAC